MLYNLMMRLSRGSGHFGCSHNVELQRSRYQGAIETKKGARMTEMAKGFLCNKSK